MFNKISVIVIVKNAEATIEKTLLSAKSFDEVVVFDNGSTDKTKDIACKFSNVRLIEGTFEGFGRTKNKAIELAHNDWVLVLDADEELQPELSLHILRKALDQEVVYSLCRQNFYKETAIRHCGWNNEKVRRLFNRRFTSFTPDKVHEDVSAEQMKEEVISAGAVFHYSYRNLEDFIIKINHFSSLFAESNKGKRQSSPTKAVLSGLYSFFRTYILKRGFLDGYIGLVIAFSHMATNFYKYIKLYEANRSK